MMKSPQMSPANYPPHVVAMAGKLVQLNYASFAFRILLPHIPLTACLMRTHAYLGWKSSGVNSLSRAFRLFYDLDVHKSSTGETTEPCIIILLARQVSLQYILFHCQESEELLGNIYIGYKVQIRNQV